MCTAVVHQSDPTWFGLPGWAVQGAAVSDTGRLPQGLSEQNICPIIISAICSMHTRTGRSGLHQPPNSGCQATPSAVEKLHRLLGVTEHLQQHMSTCASTYVGRIATPE